MGGPTIARILFGDDILRVDELNDWLEPIDKSSPPDAPKTGGLPYALGIRKLVMQPTGVRAAPHCQAIN